jgi:hypothetical protein
LAQDFVQNRFTESFVNDIATADFDGDGVKALTGNESNIYRNYSLFARRFNIRLREAYNGRYELSLFSMIFFN